MASFPDQLLALLRPALPAELPVDFSPGVTAAGDSRFGDYQSNAAMQLAKTLRSNPRALAEKITQEISASDLCSAVTVAGPGFLNFTLHDTVLAKAIDQFAGDPRCGVPLVTSPNRIVIDFSGPNVAKPMHVGHLRSTVIGAALDRVARFLGHEVISDNHIGDWGTQFGFVIHGWKSDPPVEANVHTLVRLYREVSARAKEDPTLRDLCKQEVVKLQAGDAENVAIWKKLVEVTLRDIGVVYDRLGVKFDHTLGESFYNPMLQPLVERLQTEGISRESEGALVIFFPETPALAETPCVVRKSDGGYLYATTDLATLEYRVHEWKADAIWYVVGAPQQLHLQQVFAAARLMGHPVDCEHIAFGSILGEDKKLMRTRSGEPVLLEDLLNEAVERAAAQVAERHPDLPDEEKAAIADAIGLGAVQYADLAQHRMSDYVFSPERMLALHGNTAPYLQNAYVRIRAIFRKCESEGIAPDERPIQIGTSAERALAMGLVRFTEAVPEVLHEFRPNLLANALYELADLFHSFYEACPVLKASEELRGSRLRLCRATAQTLQLGLGLLGIQTTERM